MGSNRCRARAGPRRISPRQGSAGGHFGAVQGFKCIGEDDKEYGHYPSEILGGQNGE
jgi:hypothetical protein